MADTAVLSTGLALTPLVDLRTGRITRPWQVYLETLVQEVRALRTDLAALEARVAVLEGP